MDAIKHRRKMKRKEDRKRRRKGNSGIKATPVIYELVAEEPNGNTQRIICGHCSETIRVHDNIPHERAGTLGICIRCGGANLFDDNLNPIPITDSDLEELPPVERAFIRDVQLKIRSTRFPRFTRTVGLA